VALSSNDLWSVAACRLPESVQRVRINLWNTTRDLSLDGLEEVLVTNFAYEPLR
jgi:hypothetical protein